MQTSSFTLGFNLREPHKMQGQTNLYCVVRIDNKQIKLPLGINVYAYHWDKRKQLCLVNGAMCEEVRINNIHANEKIFAVKQKEMKIIDYLCSGEKMNATDLEAFIKEQIKGIEIMANEQNLNHNVMRTKKASNIIKKAFEIYCTEITSIKDSSKEIYEKYINAFLSYLITKDIDKISSLSQKGINKYKDYLYKEVRNSPRVCNNKVQFIVTLINDVISIHNAFEREQKFVKQVNYIKLQEVNAKGQDKKRRPLTEEELNKLVQCKNLTPKEIEYRDLFILECYCGYRASDSHRLFDKSLQEYCQIKGNEYIMITPKKEERKNITAIIWLNAEIKQILSKYEQGFKYVVFNDKFEKKYIYYIKKIAKKANLDSYESYIDAKGNKCNDYLYNIIGSHFGRYTFIYNGLFKWNLTPSELCDFTGHANDKMINEVYAIYSKQDKFNKANKAIEKVLSINEITSENTQSLNTLQAIEKGKELKEKELIEEYKEVLVFLGARYEEIADINNLDKLVTMSYVDYGREFYKIGVDVESLKGIWNAPKLTLKEKKLKLHELIENANERLAECK